MVIWNTYFGIYVSTKQKRWWRVRICTFEQQINKSTAATELDNSPTTHTITLLLSLYGPMQSGSCFPPWLINTQALRVLSHIRTTKTTHTRILLVLHVPDPLLADTQALRVLWSRQLYQTRWQSVHPWLYSKSKWYAFVALMLLSNDTAIQICITLIFVRGNQSLMWCYRQERSRKKNVCMHCCASVL